MIGIVCRVFRGHTLFTCLDMTPNQLNGMYLEGRRQGARERLAQIENIALAQGGDKAKDVLDRLQMDANPFDPEEDGDFDADDVKLLKSMFGQSVSDDRGSIIRRK